MKVETKNIVRQLTRERAKNAGQRFVPCLLMSLCFVAVTMEFGLVAAIVAFAGAFGLGFVQKFLRDFRIRIEPRPKEKDRANDGDQVEPDVAQREIQ